MACLPDDSALVRQKRPESVWSLEAQLLASIVDRIAELHYSWLGSKLKARDMPPRPKPIQRPGVTPVEDETRMGAGAIPVDEFDVWLAGMVEPIEA